jgi:hypothetical protein
MDNKVETFDPVAAVEAYRLVIAQRDAIRGETAKAEHDRVARRLRDVWKAWHGEDCLYEAAFGEPE